MIDETSIPQRDAGMEGQTPRRGLIPFGHDVDLTSDRVLSEPMPAGSLGEIRLILSPPQVTADFDETGFTFDEEGNLIEGNLRDDFYNNSYYNATPVVHIKDDSQSTPIPNLKINVWIEGASHIASVGLDPEPFLNERMIGAASSPFWNYETRDGRKSSGLFVLPRDNNVLRKLRINFSKENEPEVKNK